MNTSQMTNRDITKLSLYILIIGQLKNRDPRRNRNNQISLLIFAVLNPLNYKLSVRGIQFVATSGYIHMCSFVSYHIFC
jgi:hypothetical protein